MIRVLLWSDCRTGWAWTHLVFATIRSTPWAKLSPVPLGGDWIYQYRFDSLPSYISCLVSVTARTSIWFVAMHSSSWASLGLSLRERALRCASFISYELLESTVEIEFVSSASYSCS